MSSEVAFQRSRAKALAVLATGAFFVMAGLLLVFVLDPREFEVDGVTMDSVSWGVLPLLVAPLTMSQGLWLLWDREPGLTLTERGLLDRSGVLSPGFVSWDEVVAFRPTRFFLVGVKTSNWPHIRARFPLWRRLLSMLSLRFLGSDFHVSSFGVAARRGELLQALRAGRERYLRARLPSTAVDDVEACMYVEPRAWPARCLLGGVAFAAFMVWMFAHGFARISHGEWHPVEGVAFAVAIPTWLTATGAALATSAAGWDLLARLIWRPVTLRVTRNGITYRALFVPWDAVVASYTLSSHALGVEIDSGRMGTPLPWSWRLRRMLNRIRGRRYLAFDVAGMGAASQEVVLSRILAATPPTPSDPSP